MQGQVSCLHCCYSMFILHMKLIIIIINSIWWFANTTAISITEIIALLITLCLLRWIDASCSSEKCDSIFVLCDPMRQQLSFIICSIIKICIITLLYDIIIIITLFKLSVLVLTLTRIIKQLHITFSRSVILISSYCRFTLTSIIYSRVIIIVK